MSNGNLPTTIDDSFPDEPASDSAMGAAPLEALAKPRLSILHLLVWTATSAAAMKVIHWLSTPSHRSFQLEDAYNVVFSIYSGTVVGGVLIWIARRWRRLKFPVEPGEWLLIVQGIGVLLVTFFTLVDRMLFNEEWIWPLSYIALAAAGLIPLIGYRGSWPWRLVIVGVAGVYAIGLFLIYPGGWDALALCLYSLFGLLSFVTIGSLAAVGIDYQRGLRRGWVHGVGVVTVLLFAAGHVGLLIYELVN